MGFLVKNWSKVSSKWAQNWLKICLKFVNIGSRCVQNWLKLTQISSKWLKSYLKLAQNWLKIIF